VSRVVIATRLGFREQARRPLLPGPGNSCGVAEEFGRGGPERPMEERPGRFREAGNQLREVTRPTQRRRRRRKRQDVSRHCLVTGRRG
jgi:hypothetical protein